MNTTASRGATLRLPDPAQQQAALAKANRVRRAGAQVRREVASGVLTFGDALTDPRAGALTVFSLLTAQRGVGCVKARERLRRLQISEHRRVRDLTERQVRLLADHRRRG